MVIYLLIIGIMHKSATLLWAYDHRGLFHEIDQDQYFLHSIPTEFRLLIVNKNSIQMEWTAAVMARALELGTGRN